MSVYPGTSTDGRSPSSAYHSVDVLRPFETCRESFGRRAFPENCTGTFVNNSVGQEHDLVLLSGDNSPRGLPARIAVVTIAASRTQSAPMRFNMLLVYVCSPSVEPRCDRSGLGENLAGNSNIKSTSRCRLLGPYPLLNFKKWVPAYPKGSSLCLVWRFEARTIGSAHDVDHVIQRNRARVAEADCRHSRQPDRRETQAP